MGDATTWPRRRALPRDRSPAPAFSAARVHQGQRHAARSSKIGVHAAPASCEPLDSDVTKATRVRRVGWAWRRAAERVEVSRGLTWFTRELRRRRRRTVRARCKSRAIAGRRRLRVALRQAEHHASRFRRRDTRFNTVKLRRRVALAGCSTPDAPVASTSSNSRWSGRRLQVRVLPDARSSPCARARLHLHAAEHRVDDDGEARLQGRWNAAHQLNVRSASRSR